MVTRAPNNYTRTVNRKNPNIIASVSVLSVTCVCPKNRKINAVKYSIFAKKSSFKMALVSVVF